MCKKGLEISVNHIAATISEPHCKRSRAENDGKHMDSSKEKGIKREKKSRGAGYLPFRRQDLLRCRQFQPYDELNCPFWLSCRKGSISDHISDKTESRPTLSSEECWRRRRCPKIKQESSWWHTISPKILGSRGMFSISWVERRREMHKGRRYLQFRRPRCQRTHRASPVLYG